MAHSGEEEETHTVEPSSVMGPQLASHTFTPMEYLDLQTHTQSYSVAPMMPPAMVPSHMMVPVVTSMPHMSPMVTMAAPKRRGRATAAVAEEIEQSIAMPAPKKRNAQKKRKTESSRTTIAKRTSNTNAQATELMTGMVYAANSIGMGNVHMKDDDDPSTVLLQANQIVPTMVVRVRTPDDTRAAQRSANALREYQRRARETPSERAARRAANAARARQRRAEETPEERSRRLHREAIRQQRRRDNETERERAARRAANALRQQERRAREAMARQQNAQLREQQQQQMLQQQQLLQQQQQESELDDNHASSSSVNYSGPDAESTS